jgi:rod shape-determining protein MreC
MPRKPGKLIRKVSVIAQIFNILGQIVVFIAFFASIGLLVLNKTKPDLVEPVKISAASFILPVMQVTNNLASYTQGVGESIMDFGLMYKRNKELEKENADLLQIKLKLYSLEEENRRLKKQLQYMPAPEKNLFTARLVAKDSSPYLNTAMIVSEDVSKLAINDVVINKDGLVGRIENTSQNIASLLLITDKRSKTPIVIKRTREKAILAGEGDLAPQLTYIPQNHTIQVGDEVMTSGDGGVFPADLPVGIVSKVEGLDVQVQTYVNWPKLEYVFVMKDKVENKGITEKDKTDDKNTNEKEKVENKTN